MRSKGVFVFFMAAIIFRATMAMAATGSISGHLSDSNGNPIAGYSVTAYATKQQGGSNPIASTQSNGSGDFTLSNVPEGSVYLQSAGASAAKNYQWTYWDGSTGTTNYNNAVAIPLAGGGQVTGINMTLLAGGTVVATFSDAQGNPITGMSLLLYPGAACNTQNLPSFPSAQGANQVTAYGVPPGTVYAKPWASSSSYILSWWGGGTNCNQAVGIPVVAGQTSQTLNFTLAEGGQITGTVTDPQGNPLVNMSVYALTGSPCGQTNYVTGSSTNQSGAYAVSVPVGTSYYLRAYDYSTRIYIPLWGDGAAGTANCSGAQAVAVNTTGAVPGTNFTMQLGGSVSGTVKDASAQPLTGIVVQAYNAQGFYMGQAATDAQGAFTITGLAPGYALIYADGTSTALNHVRKWWDGTTGDLNRYRATGVNISAAAPVSGLNFVLEAAGSVSGTITDHTGAPLPGVSIRGYATSPLNSAANFASATTGSDGSYILRGVPGQVFLEANAAASGINAASAWWTGSGGQFGPAKARPLAVAPGATVSGINMQLAQGGSISGKITDSVGNGLSGMSVVAGVETDCSMAQAASVGTDANGVYTLVGVPTGKAHVRASGGNHVPRWKGATGSTASYQDSQAIPVVAGQGVSGIDVALPLGGGISGSVTGPDGKPLYGVIVSSADQACSTTTQSFGATAVSFVDGSFTISGVPVGTAYVQTSSSLRRSDHAVTWHNGGTGTGTCSAAQAVTVTENATSGGVALTLPHGAIVNGVLSKAGPVGLSCVAVWSKTGSACPNGAYAATAVSQYDGSYTLYGLPAGNAYIGTTASATGQRWRDQYWNGTTGVSSCSQAAPLAVSGGDVVDDVNMTLPALVSPMATNTLLLLK